MISPRFFLIRAVVIGSLWLAVARPGSGQSVARAGTNLISIDAREVPLEVLLKDFSDIVAVEYLLLAPEAERLPVSLKLSSVQPELGLRKILDKAEVDYALAGGDGKPFRIIVGSVKDVGRRTPSETVRGAEDVPEEIQEPEVDAAPNSDTATGEPSEYPSGPPDGYVSPGPGPEPFYATGMAEPGAAPFAPGVPPPDLPEVTETDTPEATQRDSPGTRTPPAPSRSRWVTGSAVYATDAAVIQRPPARRVAATAALLALGLSLGTVLVRGPRE